jgi:SAM-dependent methyltransferase
MSKLGIKKKKTSLLKAQKWAREVWDRAVKRWKVRDQDYNYRRLLARPAMKSSMKALHPIKDGVFVDVGCGEGSETSCIKKILLKQGNRGVFYGFDQSQELIRIARAKKEKGNSIKSIFDYGLTNHLVSKYKLDGKVDIVFSTFLLQEISDVDSHFKTIANCLKKGGKGIFILVHPNFGERMLKKGALKVNLKLKSKSWRWVAEYPIVEEKGRTFYVPYFHRSLADYTKMLRKYFNFVEFSEFQPSKKVVKKCEREQLSPFYNHDGNAYYPEIIKSPSSLVFIVTKQRVEETVWAKQCLFGKATVFVSM